MRVMFLAPLLAGVRAQLDTLPFMCISDPPVRLDAGTTVVSILIENPFGRGCKAVLQFADLAFWPITYSFGQAFCNGTEQASFLVPVEAPDGDAFIIWDCAGHSPTCIRAQISNGQGSLALNLDQVGTVGCLSGDANSTSTNGATATSGSGVGVTACGTETMTSEGTAESTIDTATETDAPTSALDISVSGVSSMTDSLPALGTTAPMLSSTTSVPVSLNTNDGFSQVSSATGSSTGAAASTVAAVTTITVLTTLLVSTCSSSSGSP